MKLISNQRKGELFCIISGLLYGLVGYFGINVIHADISVYTMLFWRFLISTACVTPFILLSTDSIKNQRNESFQAFLSGVVFYSISAIGYFIASRLIGTGLAMVILFTYPAFVMLLNYLMYKTAVGRIYYAAIGLIFIGMLFLVDMQDATFDIAGIGFGLFAALGYACYVVASKKNQISPLISTGMVSAGCMITCFICSLLDATFTIPSDLTVWVNLLCIGIICTAIPIILLLEGLRFISSEKGSILSVLEPIFVVIFGVALLGEHISMMQISGIIIILGGALVTLLSKK